MAGFEESINGASAHVIQTPLPVARRKQTRLAVFQGTTPYKSFLCLVLRWLNVSLQRQLTARVLLAGCFECPKSNITPQNSPLHRSDTGVSFAFVRRQLTSRMSHRCGFVCTHNLPHERSSNWETEEHYRMQSRRTTQKLVQLWWNEQ